MKAEEKYQQILSEFKKKHLFELLYLPVIIVAFFALKIYAAPYFEEGLFLIAFGLLHLLASNILSFMYNLNWVIFPIALKATPNRLKIIGGLSILISIGIAVADSL